MTEVLELFTELAAIPSPPGEERAVADVVATFLRGCALDVDEDDAGPRIGATAGNLYTRLDATRRVLAEGRPHAGIELLFTPKEEVGLIGAAAFDESRLLARHGFVYDQAAPIGDVVLGAPYSQALEVKFHGQASHAGMYPDEGRNAIVAAARAIADLRLGRVDDETTANVGVIRGGTAGNIVAEWCADSPATAQKTMNSAFLISSPCRAVCRRRRASASGRFR